MISSGHEPSLFDDVFGQASVDLKYFDPDFFPGRCVVMDICDRAGIEFDGGEVIWVNESLNLNATKFLHAIGTYRVTLGKSMPSSMTGLNFLKWESLVQDLGAVPGPPLRLHSSLTSTFAESFKAEKPWLEKCLGRSMPATLAVRRNDEGVRSEADLKSFDRDTLDWLEEFTGECVGLDGHDPAVASAVGEMLNRVSILQMPAVSVMIAWDRLRLKAKRQFKKMVWYL